jgi:hypothetical protein
LTTTSVPALSTTGPSTRRSSQRSARLALRAARAMKPNASAANSALARRAASCSGITRCSNHARLVATAA